MAGLLAAAAPASAGPVGVSGQQSNDAYAIKAPTSGEPHTPLITNGAADDVMNLLMMHGDFGSVVVKAPSAGTQIGSEG